ncbi:ABC transporter substrate-binding protein [Dictyobacter alpinus]|uniref:ABC transporter substrate-binding protein n=1 Tax=Dictyobacter alpinus TaxID=2014873 RepID=A0A402B1D4_9CHLR|nr:ABC transporter substrate-binding protein [Dictyobacter alpinus]GCE25164.1 ABC transporter substrate-binding protein [Dictyobacter alpinus]
MTTRRQFLIRAATAVGMLTLAGCGLAPSTAAVSSDAITFGVSGPFTGDNAEYGQTWKKAWAMVLDEVNSKGGINGRKIELNYQDSQADPKQSVLVAQKFASDPTILAELGDFASPASMAASSIYQRAGLVQFGFTNSHPKFTSGGDHMFSTSVTQSVAAVDMAKRSINELKGTKQAVLYLNTDWGNTTAGIYINKAKSLGIDIVLEKNYLSTEKDFRALLLQVKAANPNLIALHSYYNDAALIVQQARLVGITAPIFADGSAYSPQFISLAGNAANGVILTAEFLPTDPRPEVQTFVKAYKKRYQTIPDGFAEGAYDALHVLIWAVKQGGATREGIFHALKSGKDIPSLQYGPFQFGPDRRVAQYKSYLVTVQNGQFVPWNG